MNFLSYCVRMLWCQVFRPLLGVSLILIIVGGCTKTDNSEAPSRRTDIPEAGQENRADRSDRPDGRSDAQEPVASGSPRAPRGEVKRNEYTVQVGIFNRADAADQLAFDLRAQRVNNFVQPVGNQWRVCVGKYYTEGRAMRMAKKLQGMGFTEAKVITPGN